MRTWSLFLFPLVQILVGGWWTVFASNISSHKVVLIFLFLYSNITWESRLRSVVNFPRCVAPLSLDKPSRGRRPELRRTCPGCRWLACLFQFCHEIKPGRSNWLLLTYGVCSLCVIFLVGCWTLRACCSFIFPLDIVYLYLLRSMIRTSDFRVCEEAP